MTSIGLVAIIMIAIMLITMLLGIPMAIGMAFSGLACLWLLYPEMDVSTALQQLYVGLNSYVLLAVPLFMLAAEIMCVGECADRLLQLVRVFFGHVPGGTAITSVVTCTLFGAISGSTQATFVAIGRPMFGELSKNEYDESHSLGSLMMSATIALLIPPSITMVIYAVVANCSVGEMFIAGVGPGIVFCAVIAVYEFIYAKRKHIPTLQRANGKEIAKAIRGAILPLMFPVIILGGIYSGIFSPTEAAAVSCGYAFILEKFVYRSMTMRQLGEILLDIGLVTGTVFILCGAGQIMSWVLSFAGIPQAMASLITGMGLGEVGFLFVVSVFFFIACMFMDATPVMYVLVPIFAPLAVSLGVDPVLMGVVIALQVSIGCVTPPFGYNIFTAMAIFDKPFVLVTKRIWMYLFLGEVVTMMVIFFPDIALILRNIAF